ncbi:MAG: nuclear transport factor 2 family protein [Pseudomonadota bacterium]
MATLHHTLLTALGLAMLLMAGLARADEAAVRIASQALVEAWNRHDMRAWSAHLAEDTWYTETNDFYERFKGRDKAVSAFSYSVENSDLQWDIVRMKTRPDGVVSVVLSQRMSMLPKVDGKYKSVFTSDPALARWRRDTDGRWRVVFFTSDKGWALAEIKKDDEGRVAAVALAPAASATAPRAAQAGGEPPQYTAFWGRWAQGCNYCHGRPPVLPSSEVKSRIVAVGAATADGAGMRAAMQRKELGGTMDHIVADPALTDADLEAVRRYLVDVRDGALPELLVFDAPGATRELQFRNERSSRDAPVKIALLRVSGPFAVDAPRSSCRSGGRLAGQSTCRLVLRAAAGAAPGSTGAVELQFAPTTGLAPRPRRTMLRLGA